MKKTSLKELAEKHRKNQIKAIVIASSAAVLLAASIVITALSLWPSIFAGVGLGDFSRKAEKYSFSAHFIDVGKADSCLISCECEYALIDCGNPGNGTEVKRYLKRHGVDYIKLAFGTHPDSDHIGGYPYLFDEVRAGAYIQPIMNSEMKDDNDNKAVLKSLNGARLINAKAGDEFTLGSAKIKVLSPSREENEANDTSLVLMVSYGNIKLLLTGDSTEKIEKTLTGNIKADILKVAHHGSKTSTSDGFLNKVSPKYAVISVGKDSSNLPNDEVLFRLDSHNITTLRTDRQGTIIACSNGSGIDIITEKEDRK